jgi:fumarylacetoacetate (FAA) hydrolase
LTWAVALGFSVVGSTLQASRLRTNVTEETMKLATLRDGTRDGKLIVVSKDGRQWTSAEAIATTLQSALDCWDESEPALQALSARLNAGDVDSDDLNTKRLMAPLPRAYEWVDGSAFLNHVILVRKARNAEPPATLRTDPLVYQGGSGVLLGPRQDMPLVDPAWGLDFEAEICAILGDTPLGTKADGAAAHIKLFMLVNDFTWRNLIPRELAKSFGFFQSKPASAFSPFAVTPDELGGALQGGRVHLHMRNTYNGDVVGNVHAGPEMHFGFHELVEHITKTRAFTAGSILGSGTISNEDRSAGISCLAERRMIEIIENGEATTPFMSVGDTIRIEMLDADDNSIFGAIDQKVVAA